MRPPLEGKKGPSSLGKSGNLQIRIGGDRQIAMTREKEEKRGLPHRRFGKSQKKDQPVQQIRNSENGEGNVFMAGNAVCRLPADTGNSPAEARDVLLKKGTLVYKEEG